MQENVMSALFCFYWSFIKESLSENREIAIYTLTNYKLGLTWKTLWIVQNCAAILQNIIWLRLGRQFPLPSRFTWYMCLRESSDKELGIHWFEWLGDTKCLSLLTDYNMFWKYWEARQTRLSQRSRANTARPGLIKLLLHAAIMPVISPFVA